MMRYVVKRLIISLIVLIAVLFLTYVLMYNIPHNYAEIVAREMSMISGSKRSAAEWETLLLSEYGLDKGLFEGFFTWLTNSLCGEFGTSWYYGVSVTEKFYPAFLNSALIGVISAFVTLVVSVPLGRYSVFCKNKKVSKFITIFSVLVVSIPVFFIIALLKYVFSIKLGWFDLGGIKSFDSMYASQCDVIADRISHMVLPVLAMSLPSIGFLTRYVHANVKGLVSSRYIKGLRAKGLSDNQIVSDHLIRNVLVPIINIFCVIMPTALSGSIVVETLFSFDGVGYVAYNALINGDIPMIMFYILHVSFLTVVFSFLSDVLCSLADYRVAKSLGWRT